MYPWEFGINSLSIVILTPEACFIELAFPYIRFGVLRDVKLHERSILTFISLKVYFIARLFQWCAGGEKLTTNMAVGLRRGTDGDLMGLRPVNRDWRALRCPYLLEGITGGLWHTLPWVGDPCH